MSYMVKLNYARPGWAVIAGVWKIASLVKVMYSVHDGTPVLMSEPVALLEADSPEKLSEATWLLEEYSSYATLIASVKHALSEEKKRVFITAEALGVADEDKLKACCAGGLDGVVPYPYKPQVEKGVNVVNLDVESAPGYLYLSLEELSAVKNVKGKIAGVIVEFPGKVTQEVVYYVREYIYRYLGQVELMIAINHLVATPELVRKIRGAVSGVVLTSLGKVLKMKVSEKQREVFLYRCSNCMIDILSSTPLRKCPYCQDRLSELLKEVTDRMLSYTARELKFINADFMARFNPARVRIELR